MPDSKLKDSANLLVLPNIDAANIAYNLLKTAAGYGVAIGPVMFGCARPVHILTLSVTVAPYHQHDSLVCVRCGGGTIRR